MPSSLGFPGENFVGMSTKRGAERQREALCNSVAACLRTAIAFNNFHDR